MSECVFLLTSLSLPSSDERVLSPPPVIGVGFLWPSVVSCQPSGSFSGGWRSVPAGTLSEEPRPHRCQGVCSARAGAGVLLLSGSAVGASAELQGGTSTGRGAPAGPGTRRCAAGGGAASACIPATGGRGPPSGFAVNCPWVAYQEETFRRPLALGNNGSTVVFGDFSRSGEDTSRRRPTKIAYRTCAPTKTKS